MKTFAVVVCFALLLANEGNAQHLFKRDSTTSYFIGAKFQEGNILVDNVRLAEIVKQNPIMVQADFSILKNTQRVWDYGRCFSRYGLSLSYINFGNSVNLGNGINAVLYTEPFLLTTSKVTLTLKAGAGFTYLNKVFNEDTNPDNISYSKHLSFLLMLNPNLYYTISKRVRLNVSTQFNHISNGGSRWPNWGLNFITTGVGVEYIINPQPLVKHPSTPFTDKSLKIITHVFAGNHTSEPLNQWPSQKRFVTGINSGVIKRLGRVNALGIGGELSYDGISSYYQQESGTKFYTTAAAINVQNYFFFGKLLFGQQVEYQLTPTNPNIHTRYFQRFFLEYKLKRSWYAGISLRSHWKVSDYLSFSTGIIL